MEPERELESITEFAKEVADLNWTMLLPKSKLSAKEADSRTAVQELIKKAERRNHNGNIQ